MIERVLKESLPGINTHMCPAWLCNITRVGIAALGLSLLFPLPGCSFVQARSTGAPILERGEVVQDEQPPPDESAVTVTPLPSTRPGSAQTVPDEQPPAPVAAAPSNNAVIALLDNAGQQSRTGNLDAAAAGLERALRIEPRNPEIWHRLASIRLQQGQFDQAASLAAKSINLAGNNPDLIARNKLIINQARQRRGKLN